VVTITQTALHLEAFGISQKHALRRLLTAFRQRGWRDPGDAALLVIRKIEKQPGVAANRAAAAAPPEFFDLNHITRKELAEALVEIATRR
jgi:hypothetical protein